METAPKGAVFVWRACGRGLERLRLEWTVRSL